MTHIQNRKLEGDSSSTNRLTTTFKANKIYSDMRITQIFKEIKPFFPS